MRQILLLLCVLAALLVAAVNTPFRYRHELTESRNGIREVRVDCLTGERAEWHPEKGWTILEPPAPERAWIQKITW